MTSDMTTDIQNPYSTPQSRVTSETAEDLRLEKIASGQRLVIRSILLYFTVIGLQFASAAIPADSGLLLAVLGLFLAAGLGTIVLGLLGIWRLATGLGHHPVIVFMLLIVMMLPLIGLLALLSLNARATTELRKGGYRVGLLGAKKSETLR